MLPSALSIALFVLPALLQGADLPVKDGLLLRLDASAQPELRRAGSMPPLGLSQPFDYWIDSASKGRMAMQPLPDRRPGFITDGATAYVELDGKDDFLLLGGERRLLKEMTIFVLAAPKRNSGAFNGLFAAAESGKNDYTSGINVDLGPFPSKDLSVVNVESAGAGGFADLLVPGLLNAAERPFGDFHLFTVVSRVGKNGIQLFLDGFKGGERDRLESLIGCDQFTIGSRLYSNDGSQPPYAQGFFEGAIADVIVYERALGEKERTAVEQALLEKTVALEALLHGDRGHRLEAVSDPPVIQMLVPGFSVHELPVKVGNLDNLRYRHDGALVGLGYDGRIHLLTDTDGDGLEDADKVFSDKATLRGPIGMVLTDKQDPRGNGVFVASKGKVSLIIDRDRDDRADEEIIVATGWKESFHSVDTLGVAIDPKDGSIYFGLGCANFGDPFLIDPSTGKSGYKITDTHGTVQRVSADFSHRETIATGVRFTCAMAFNRDGDLFATEQEGATWLPNGNPLDEFLWIERGKHYGFPPRHPRHLPDVRDEPAVIEYGPQHQSTVGMVFNESVNGGPTFGPESWRGDAIVCGESRGKIWRTRLVKTPMGYVAQNQLIACLGLLTIDACVTPRGELAVCCHSGPPDWGTGPTGEGRIFKIRHARKDLPQPVLAWAAAPDELRVAFDRPLEPSDWARAKEKVKIERGRYVSAGDRFEVVRPGYQVVRDQLVSPRGWVDVLGLSLSADRRTIHLRVPRQTEAVSYAISLPLPESWRVSSPIAQHPRIDIQASLNGLAAQVTTAEGKELRTVLPHPSLKASLALAGGSAEHETFLRAALSRGSTVTLRGAVDVSNPYVPAVQPGARLDWNPSEDPYVTAPFSVVSDFIARGKEVVIEKAGSPAGSRLHALQPVVARDPDPDANGLFLARGELRHLLAASRCFTPWAAESADGAGKKPQGTRDDVKGSWIAGRRIFFGAATRCSTCHKIRGEGTTFGPDLSNLIHRDRDSVLADIVKPFATINPDQTGMQATLDDGRVLAGLVRSLTPDTLVLALADGQQVESARSKVVALEPLTTSLMPEGLVEKLSRADVEDLLTFLLVSPLDPATITRTDPSAPPSRKMSQVAQVLGTTSSRPGKAPRPLRILLCSGPKDHGLDEHDYPLWLARWSQLLALGEKVSVAQSAGFPTADQLSSADVAVFFNANPGWTATTAAALDAFHEKGGGAVYLHYAIDGGPDANGVADRMGLSFTLGSRFRHGELDLAIPQRGHPITRGFPARLPLLDESYWALRGDTSRIDVLATQMEDGAPQPQVWALERRKSRIVGCIPGHYNWTFDDPLFRVLVLRAICWTAREEDVDRLSELATIGARVD